jgi:hypothetical protein
VTITLVKYIIILCELAQIFIFPVQKLNNFFDFVLFVATKKDGTTKFNCSPSSFVAVIEFGIRDPRWINSESGIRGG